MRYLCDRNIEKNRATLADTIHVENHGVRSRRVK